VLNHAALNCPATVLHKASIAPAALAVNVRAVTTTHSMHHPSVLRHTGTKDGQPQDSHHQQVQLQQHVTTAPGRQRQPQRPQPQLPTALKCGRGPGDLPKEGAPLDPSETSPIRPQILQAFSSLCLTSTSPCHPLVPPPKLPAPTAAAAAGA
jgi:hypothetical protein